ncbi:unnamed protein product [Paramecium octaurelia]|uniref:Uncharacterized protein n=1 Tax=Paramecium octaurelia TaxID=43137 RepID=A0A8S1TFZ8_PAROT|nr:unnamed protein product [Paramecium octaurelia]
MRVDLQMVSWQDISSLQNKIIKKFKQGENQFQVEQG